MRKLNRGRPILAILLSCSLVAAACGGSDDDADSGSDNTEAPDDGGDDAPAATDAPDAGDDDGDDGDDAPAATDAPDAGGDDGAMHETSGVLRVGLNQDALNFDPFQLNFEHFPFIMGIYDALVRYDSELNVLPSLATEWAIADDSQSVTVTLREGVTFHSGGPVDADAVVTTYERAMNPETGGNMLGFSVDIAAVSAVDAGTVLVELKQPMPELAITDILQAISIIDPAGIDDLATRGSGSGPYMFESWSPGLEFVLEANHDYWGTGGPYLDQIVYTIYDDSDAQFAAYNSGAIDFAWNIPLKDAATLAEENIQRGHPGSLTYAFQMNANRAPFDNQNMRQMVQYATNRQGVVDAALFGQSEATVLPWAKSSPAYDESFNETWGFDLDKAKELMDAGVAEGAPTSAIINVNAGTPVSVLQAQILQADLAKIGFDLELNVLDGAAFADFYVAKDYGMITNANGNLAKYPTRLTGNSTFRLEDNRGWPDGLPQEYVDAINQASSALTAEEQDAAFANLRDVLMELSWVVNIAYSNRASAIASNVSGAGVTVDTMLILEDIQVN